MNKGSFLALAAYLSQNDLSAFRTWVLGLVPKIHPAVYPLRNQDVTPTFGGIYLLLRLTGLLESIETELEAKVGISPDDLPKNLSIEGLSNYGLAEWVDQEILYGGIDGLAQALSRHFDGSCHACLCSLIGVASGGMLGWFTRPDVNRVEFLEIIEAFKEHRRLNRLQAWLLGLLSIWPPVPDH